jgi:hypothetical protein
MTIRRTGMQPEHDDLADRIRRLPPERVEEVADFVDFLLGRETDFALTRAASSLADDAFGRVWDNPEDAAYDQL